MTGTKQAPKCSACRDTGLVEAHVVDHHWIWSVEHRPCPVCSPVEVVEVRSWVVLVVIAVVAVVVIVAGLLVGVM